MSRRGISLAELVLSFFLLAAGIIVVAQLFHASLRRNSDSAQQARACLIAAAKLAEVREWAAATGGGGYNYDNWGPYTNVTSNDPNEPMFQVTVRSAAHTVGSPATELETPQTEPRTLTQSLRKVEITVAWGAGRTYRLVSLVGDPARQLGANPVLVQATAGLTNPVPYGATVSYRATLRDSFGNPIPEVGMLWGVEPGTGDGVLDWTHRDGRTCRFLNRYYLRDGTAVPVPGTCWVRATSLYDGQNATALGPQMVLAP
ncbi:MAG: hypothetical protein AMXMBFR33_59390 [Candidatus Xenobia bacterium]